MARTEVAKMRANDVLARNKQRVERTARRAATAQAENDFLRDHQKRTIQALLEWAAAPAPVVPPALQALRDKLAELEEELGQ